MSITRRFFRGLRRAAPTGVVTVVWFGIGALGFFSFFQDVTEPTISFFVFLIVFGVAVWIPYFRFFFLIAEEVLIPDGNPSLWRGAAVGILVALVATPPILFVAGPGLATPMKVLVFAPTILALVGMNRVQRMRRPGADT